MAIQETIYRNAKPKDKPYKIFDGEGLFLLISPTGHKSWRLKYRHNAKEKLAVLGTFPTMGMKDARDKKIEFKAQLAKGLDPILIELEYRQSEAIKTTETFELVGREWIETNRQVWKQRYTDTIVHRLEKYVFPELGVYPITYIKPILMLSILRRIEETAPEMARRIKNYCSNIFKLGIATNRAEADPTYGLEVALKKYKKSHFASIDVDDTPEFVKAIILHKSRLTRQTYLSIKLMFLTFVRTNELIEAKWMEFDFGNCIWKIPGERMKKDKPHLVPLSKQTIAILTELKQMNPNSEYLFPALYGNNETMSAGTILVALKRMGYSGKMTGHGFRSLAMGILKEKLGYSHEIVDRQLAHVKKDSVDRAYDRAKFLPQRKEMMQGYADYLDSVFVTSFQELASKGVV